MKIGNYNRPPNRQLQYEKIDNMKTLEQIQEENRKLIILANNSEAKDYDEALEMESRQVGCQVKTTQSPFSPKHKKTVISNILWDDGIDEAVNERFYCHRDDHTFTVIKQDCKIIGKPLTLDRILIALQSQEIGFLDGYLFELEDKGYDGMVEQFICEWNLTKPTLEEQTEKTQRAINTLLT